MVDLITADAGLKANIETLKTAADMQKSVIDMLA
jgi:flagellar basal body rod protein FlgC